MLVGWLTSFLMAWSHRNMSETWSVAISYFSFIPVLHGLLSLATNAVLDGIGAMWWKFQSYYKILLG